MKLKVLRNPLLYTAGLDFLKLSLHMDWRSGWFLRQLQDFKDEFQEEALCSNPEAKERSLRLDGGIKFNMLRSGAGKYPYVLKCGDITVMSSNHKSEAQVPNCRVEIGSMSCWNPGSREVFSKVVSWLRCMGGTIRKQKLSEFHPAVDLLGVDFEETGFDDIRRWITRADKWNLYGEYRTPNYIAFGKGKFMLRIYNELPRPLGRGIKTEVIFSSTPQAAGY